MSKTVKIWNLWFAEWKKMYKGRIDLAYANLATANLATANLAAANLAAANLAGANLAYAHLEGAHLEGAYLEGAYLTHVDGLLSATDWLADNFEQTEEGIIVYKAIGNTCYATPKNWKIEPGSVLLEVANPTRTCTCGSGVNFGTKAYVEKESSGSDIWQCLIRWEWLADVVVPFNTDGKARCNKLQLVERIK